MSLVTFMQDNVQADTHISFAYNGGSSPGTRRTVRFIEPHQLRSGMQGFRADHEGVAKLYQLSKCSGMRLEEAEGSN